MRPASFESEEGDISLSNPLSAPQISTPRSTSPRDNTIERERLYGKRFWAKTQSLSLRSSPDDSLNDLNEFGQLDLNDGPAGFSVAGPSRSASLRSPNATPTRADFPTQGTPNYQRTPSSSSTLSRSRSLGNRLMVNTDTPREIERTPSMRLGWSRRPGDPRPPPLVDEAVRTKIEKWVKEIVVCNFDLEKGPVVERRALCRRWGPGEKENVAFSSFPDTSLFAEGSIKFSFKIRHMPPDPRSLQQPEPPSPLPSRQSSTEDGLLSKSFPFSEGGEEQKSNVLFPDRDRASEYRRWDELGREWLYGFVWFEQRRDKGIARGYMQKSLVILTHLPFPSLFFGLLDRVAPIFFEHGYSALEVACHSISTWPEPKFGGTLELPILSELVPVSLPDSDDSVQLAVGHTLLASLPQTRPLQAFSRFISSLWSIWECLLLAEPILVIAPDPKTCSEIVWRLRDLVRPVPLGGDFRPYLHIHDHDFTLLVNSNKPQPGVVVGVTNPFFRNATAHWPNIVSISSERSKTSGTSSPRPEIPSGFMSKRHRSITKDRDMLKRLESALLVGDADDPTANEALRTHFQQLTERFLVPLNRYFQTLVPTAEEGSSTIKPWSMPNFMTHLRTHGPNPLSFRLKGLSGKSRTESDFYTAFCSSPTFAGWLKWKIESHTAGLGLGRSAPVLHPSGSESDFASAPESSDYHSVGRTSFDSPVSNSSAQMPDDVFGRLRSEATNL